MKTEEIIFDDSYELTLAKLNSGAEKPDFQLDRVRNKLDALYKYEGLDWTGRGELKQAEISGAILAYQVFINELKGDE